MIGTRQRRSAFTLALMVSAMGCTDPLPWQRYTQSDFPAPVHSVSTRLGNVLNAERDLTYAPWTVSFGKGIPYAFYDCRQTNHCEIAIKNLKCDHSTGGRAWCELKLYDNATCDLVIPERREKLHISCPVDVTLEPKLFPSRNQRSER